MNSNTARICAGVMICVLMAIMPQAQAAVDSIGIQKHDGEICVLHKVETGETLYAISKLYGVTLDDILKFNPYIVGASIGVGQILLIPRYGRKDAKKRKQRKLKVNKEVPNPTEKSTKTHIVAEGETLYSISKRYEISVDDLKRVNPDLLIDDMAIGTVLRLPFPDEEATTTTEVVETVAPSSNSSSDKVHVVKQGETLYSISKQYPNTSLNTIIKKNNLEGASLKIGQKLLIPLPEEAVPVDAMPIETTPVEVGTEVIVETPDTTVSNPVANQPVNAGPNFDTYSAYIQEGKQLRKERGVATWLNENTSSGPATNYFALHNEAPLGSIVKVKNLMNNKVVFAKVIGRLPQNKQDKRSLVKLSYNAASELGALDARFLVEIESVYN